jgi:ATP synthase subunit 6
VVVLVCGSIVVGRKLKEEMR